MSRPLWCTPAGRMHREAYIIRIGDKEKDVDELRTWRLPGWFNEAVVALVPPPTKDERAWLLALADDCDWTQRMTALLDGLPVQVLDDPSLMGV